MVDADRFAGRSAMITGGLGFIGSNLAARLVALGAKVVVVDSLNPSYGGLLFNVDPVRDRLTVNVSDVRDVHSLRHLLRGQDFLFNLAGQTSHLDSMLDPTTDLDINSAAQLGILECCREVNPAVRIVFASTRQIYGRPRYLPVDERHPVSPVDVNGINKLSGEWYHRLYNDVYGIRSTVLRLTNTYGPRMRIKDARQTFVGVWVRRVLEGAPFEVWGGEQLRDLTYVDDCVEALLLASGDTAVGQVYNLGGPPPISLLALAETLIGVAGKGAFERREFPAERRAIDIGDSYSDFSLIRDQLGWEPTVCIRDGLTETVNYYSSYFGEYL